MLGTAIALAARGMAVFPCRPRSKWPATPHGLKDATRDGDVLNRWWRQNSQYNVAIATGTSNIFVADVDDLDADAELRRLEREHGGLPATVEVITPRPGRHIYFKMPDQRVRNTTSKIAPGIDTRGDGGYVLVPPSIHPSGKAYAWSVDSADAIAAAPGWLVAKINGNSNGNGNCPAAAPAEWRELIGAGVAEGQRNQTVARLAGYLLRRHVDPVFALELLQTWNANRCAPPLPAADVERTVGSICKRELKRRGNG